MSTADPKGPLRLPRHAVALLLVAASIAACAPTVGPRSRCDDAVARTPVYRVDGTPAYMGQAILIQSCAGGGAFCHAEGAADRYGVPFGLDFDAALAVDTGASLARLSRIQRTIYEHRNGIWAQILGGSMPPGTVGDAMDADLYFFFDPATLEPTGPIPPIDSADAREALRNWLSCGAPVVERIAPAPPLPCATDSACAASGICDTTAGACVAVGDVVPPLDVAFDPVWSAIYPRVIGPTCATAIGCHGLEPRSAGLDMSSETAAYDSLVGVAASTDVAAGALCGMAFATRVVPGEPDLSLIVQKLEGSPPCGDPMPVGPPLSSNAIEAIRAWIAAGAAR